MFKEELRIKIIIAGIAKSGTTALFFQIRNSLQGETECHFEPESYVDKGSPEFDNTLVKILVEKIAENGHQDFFTFDRKIYITRDIRDQLVSDLLYSTYHFLYDKPPSHIEKCFALLRQKERVPSSVSMLSLFRHLIGLSAEEVIGRIRMLGRRSQEFLAKNRDFFLLRYEDLVLGRVNELNVYLGMELSPDFEVGSEFKRVERTKNSGSWKSWFTEKDISVLRESVDEYLDSFHYDSGGWMLSETPRILREHCSLYVRRVINERRSRMNYNLIV